MAEPRVLIYDIETGGVNALNADLGFVLCFGYKWLGEKGAKVLTLEEYGGFKPGRYDDRRLLKAIWKIMSEADLLVAHYGDGFDRRFLNGRFAIKNLPPIPPIRQIDTCKLAWKNFNFSRNRLGIIAERLGCRNRKSESKFPDWWLAVSAGDMSALRRMARYCRQDVLTLEEVYLRLKAFDSTHPNMQPDRSKCGQCGSASIQYRGIYRTKERTYRKYVCLECRVWGRDAKAVGK